MKNVKFYTLGCKVNSYETQAMEGLFEEQGYSVTEEEVADIIVINTCTVTQTGAKKSRQLIHRARRNNPGSVIAVVGCLPQAEPEEVKKIKEIDVVIGSSNKKDIVRLVEEYHGKRVDAVSEIGDEFEDLYAIRQGNTRAVMKIEDGCTNFCSYCIIPYARGKVRSKPLSSIKEEATALAQQGFTEIILAGIHLGSYGRDTGETLLDAIRTIHHVEGIQRIRLGSLEPRTVTEAFVGELQRLPKVCNHLHLSLQSGCNRTLQTMNRKYSMEEYIHSCNAARAIEGMSITTDLIVGFPGETNEDFLNSLDNVERAGLTHLHIFPFSRRKGTPAADMEHQVPQKEKAFRAKFAAQLSRKLFYQFCYDYPGKEVEVLFEDVEDGMYQGLATNYLRVVVPFREGLSGTYQKVRIQEVGDHFLKGELVE